MRALLAVASLRLLLAAPAALAQHQHGTGQAMVVIAHDSAPDGRAVVGNVAHFAAVLFGADGTPQFHHNMRIAVRENGALLWETTGDSGHDYDGVNGFDLVFPVPGAYNVTATTEGSEGEVTGSFAGYVVDAAPQPASLKLTLPEAADAGAPVDIAYAITDAQGQPMAHTDALFEVRKAGALEFRIHTHGHQGPQALRYAFPTEGAHTVSILAYNAYPTPTAPVFAAFTTTKTVQVAPALPGAPVMPTLEAPDSMMNDVTMGGSQGGPFVVMSTFDPYTSVGPFSQARLSTLVVDPATMQAVQHVNFQATLTDALGRELFRSESLHEYDGILELVVGPQAPGQYHLDVKAQQGAWKGNATEVFTVLPPIEALSAGPQVVDVDGLDQVTSGAPVQGVLFAHDLAGMPFAHSEVDLQVLPKDAHAAPIVATKLHTHDDGKFAFNLTFPSAGEYILRLAPFSLEARPTPAYFGPGLGPLDVPLKVAAGSALPMARGLPLSATGAPTSATPGFEALPLLAGIGLAALLLTRRR
ncbi:MAG: hypothetical protein LC624_11570 [Halobacteriales archaeon]|nr:hypothetical protein [Halobacteriales archaeon]